MKVKAALPPIKEDIEKEICIYNRDKLLLLVSEMVVELAKYAPGHCSIRESDIYELINLIEETKLK